jgi:hypothetical protein
MRIPSLEDVVWAELVAGPAVKRLRRNERVIDAFAVHGWIKHTSRRDEFAITENGRLVAEKRLLEHWPDWRDDLASFTVLGLSPEDPSAWNLLKRARSNQVPRTLAQINRRTLNAWERRHSKVAVGLPSKAFSIARITVDEVTRLRLPPGSSLLLQNGKVIDCDRLMGLFGEIIIPERAWDGIAQIDACDGALVSIENKGAFVDFPAVPQAALVYLPGDNTSALQQVTARLRIKSLIHFGDLDASGIQIYESLVSQGFAARHFIPSYVEEYLITHAQPCKIPWPHRDYSAFHPVIATLAAKGLWLEHEALVLDQRFEAELASLIQRNLHEAAQFQTAARQD